MPVILGALYIGAMVYIVTRARRRREQTRLEVETGRRVARGEIRAEEAAQRVAPPKPTLNLSAMIGNLFMGGGAGDNEEPRRILDWTVPAELRDLPEPDLDMLVNP